MVEDAPTSPFLDDMYKELALALGDAVWGFARIEWLTYQGLGHLSNDKLDELVGDVPFRTRTSMLRRIFQRRDAPEDIKSQALAALKAVEDLAERRNLIVHNPWRIWADLDERKYMTEISKYTRPEKKIDLQELREFVLLCDAAERDLRHAIDAL